MPKSVKSIKRFNKRSNKRFNKQSNTCYLASNVENHPQFVKSLDKITQFTDTELDIKTKDAIKSMPCDFDSLLKLNDQQQFKDARLFNQYCNKTGRFLRCRTTYELQRMVKHLAVERVKELINQQWGDYYAIEWLDTGPKMLKKLALTDPQGYFVYSCSLFMHYRQQFASDTPLPVEIRNFFLVDKIESMTQLEKNLGIEKATDSVESVQGAEFLKQLIYCNELIRKLLGLIGPKNIDSFAHFSIDSIKAHCLDVETLIAFQLSIKQSIQNCLLAHFRTVKDSRLEQFEKHKRIQYQDLLNIKVNCSGLSSFHHQPVLRKLNKKESILYDMLDTLDIDGIDDANMPEDDMLDNLLDDFAVDTVDTVDTVTPGLEETLADFEINEQAAPAKPHRPDGIFAKQPANSSKKLQLNTAMLNDKPFAIAKKHKLSIFKINQESK